MEIKTKSGHTILIDDEDWNLVRGYTWCVVVLNTNQYARTSCRINGKVKHTYMHRLIMGNKQGMIIDHVDRNGLNNTKGNLRFCTNSQNLCNAISRKGISMYKGVCKRNNQWVARCNKNRNSHFLGYFSTELEAAIAYNKAAIELHGEFARLNEV
jgi:hypothetical protein